MTWPPRERLARPTRTSWRGPLILIVLGVAVMQVAWLTAIPPYGGVDEFDHSYRAGAVAHGELLAQPSDATRGTGAFVEAPADIVEAAGPECRNLPYTKETDCSITRTHGRSVAPSGAGRYNPLYYAMVGWPSLMFEGVSANYAMRATSALLCLVLFTLALATNRGPRTAGWSAATCLLCLTPVVLYSTTIVAPNGMEMMAALLFWSAWLALLRTPPGSRPRLLLPCLVLSGVLLGMLRSLGPLWCLLVLAAGLIAERPSPSTLRELWRTPSIKAASALVTAAMLVGTLWTSSQGALQLARLNPEPLRTIELLVLMIQAEAVWLIQTISAVPSRANLAPAPVYVAALSLMLGLVCLAWRRVARHYAIATAFVATLVTVIPAAITMRTYDEFGVSWQGRYVTPLALGVLVVLGAGLSRADRAVRPWWIGVGGVAFCTMQAVSLAAALRLEIRISPGVANGDWWFRLPVVAAAVMMTSGAAVAFIGAASGIRIQRDGTLYSLPMRTH